MTTGDRSGFGLPLEFQIPLGQVTDGNPPSTVTPLPAPNALVGGSPGLATGAAAPPVGPTLPDGSDPQAMTLLISKLANELLGGSSVVPIPGSSQVLAGVSPTLMPGSAPTASGPSVGGDVGPASGVGVSPPGLPSGPPPIGPGIGPHAGVGVSPPGAPSGWPSPSAPQSGVGVSPPGSPGGIRPPGTSPELVAAPTPSVPATSPGGVPAIAGSPFGAPLDLSAIGGMPSFSMSVLPEPSSGELPYYLPGADVLGLESGGSRIESYEAAPRRDDALARDLGGNAFDPYSVRKDFPILEERVHGGKRLVWLDNAATTQKPRAVIDRLSYFYEHENSNVHRAAHTLAARSTDAYEKARESARRFLNGPSVKEIVWVRGATEGINLIAQSWGRRHVGKDDEIVITHLEHHANIVPWQMLCAEKGARLRVAPVDDRGDVILDEYEKLLGPKTRLVSIPHVSNALGTITPTKQMVEIAHRYGARVMVDGAQAVSHMKVDVQDLGCEWYVFSGHKVFAPTGIGVVWAKEEILAQTPPWQGGGNMIEDVTFEKTRYQPPPFRFEAGTGSIADAVGLGAAIEYVERIGMDVIDRYEHDLLVYGTQRLATVPGLTIIGTSPTKAGVLSFVLDGQRTEEVSAALDKEGIATRSGHHCAQPILRRFGLEATVRASLAFYNVCEDIDALVEALHRLQGVR